MIPQNLSAEASPFYDPADWRPNAAQKRILRVWAQRKHQIMALCGGWGVGKSRLALYICALNHELQPGLPGAIIADSMSRLSSTISNEFDQTLGTIGWEYRNAFHGQPSPHYLSPELDGKRTKVWLLSWKRPSTAARSANSLEGRDLAYAILDEANVFRDEEVATAMLGRVRSGNPGQVLLMGKPTLSPWWCSFALERGGYSQISPSTENAHNLPDFRKWVSTLSRREVLENLMCQPQTPVGAVLDNWTADTYPAGNIAPTDWKPEPWMPTFAAFDFGVRFPHALLISHDHRIGPDGADVVWSEACPDGASVEEVCRILLRGRPDVGIPPAWPANRSGGPDGAIPIQSVFGDRAGRNRRDDAAMSSAMSDILQPPPVGLGLRCKYTDESAKIPPIVGIKLLWRLIRDNASRRRLLCSHQLWNRGPELSTRSFAQCVLGYRWTPGSNREQISKRDGFDHGIDALRYWAINKRWPADIGLRDAYSAFQQPAHPQPIAGPGDRSIAGYDR